MAFRVTGDLDVDALATAVDALVARHEALRTTFTEVDGHLIAELATDDSRFRQLSVAGSTVEGWEAAVRAATAMAGEAFDLARGPLLRVGVWRTSADEHLVVLVVHHIVFDAWSQGVAWAELAELYDAARRGRPAELPDVELQLGDAARWQLDRCTGDVLDRELGYWRERLAGAPELLPLPTDHPRPAVAGYEGAQHRFSIGPELTAAVRAAARQQSTTVFMIVTAALDAFLARHSGIDDIVVGTQTAGRGRPEFERIVGYLSNTLPLRVDCSGDPTFAELVARVERVVVETFDHQDVPFERLLAELRPQRSLAYNAVFQVLLVMPGRAQAPVALPGVTIEPVELDLGTSHVDVMLAVEDRGDELAATLEYRLDLFEPDTARRWGDQLVTLLTAAVADPHRPISELPLAAADERARLLAEWNGPAAAPADVVGLHQLVEYQAATRPDVPAVDDGTTALTFRELDVTANRLAHRLVAAGVRAGDLVGVCLPRCADAVVAEVAVLKAGGAYVPVDVDEPAERVQEVLADAGVAVVVATAATVGLLDPGPTIVLLGAVSETSPREVRPERTVTAPDVPADPDRVAYVMYTSGSTGRPKAIMHTHRANLALLPALRDHLGIDEDDIVLQASSFGFDLSSVNIWLAAAAGARLFVVDRDTVADSRALRHAIEAHGVTVAHLPPRVWRLLVDSGWGGGPRFVALAASEPAPPELWDALRRGHAPCGTRTASARSPCGLHSARASPAAARTSTARCRTSASTSSTTPGSCARSARWARSASAAPASCAATSGGRG